MFYSMCYADEYYHNQLCIVEFKVTAHMESSRNKGLGQYVHIDLHEALLLELIPCIL